MGSPATRNQAEGNPWLKARALWQLARLSVRANDMTLQCNAVVMSISKDPSFRRLQSGSPMSFYRNPV